MLNNEQIKPRPVKKKRGGQPGNRNARKHGLYSLALSPDEFTAFTQDMLTQRILPDVALVRAKLRSVLLHSPLNRRALDDAAGQLAAIYADKLRLDKTTTRHIKRVFWSILETCSLVAECENQNKKVSPKPIERTLPFE